MDVIATLLILGAVVVATADGVRKRMREERTAELMHFVRKGVCPRIRKNGRATKWQVDYVADAAVQLILSLQLSDQDVKLVVALINYRVEKNQQNNRDGKEMEK